MKSSATLYSQIYDDLRADIASGKYQDGSRLPTEAEPAKQYFVSRITSKKALTKLAEDGLILRIPGRGSFVKKNCPIPAAVPTYITGKPIVALVMGGYDSSFGLEIVQGALETADEVGMHLILKDTQNEQKREAAILKSLLASGVAGIIVQPAHGELYNEAILNAVYSKFPIVMIDRYMAGIDVPFVGVDNTRLGGLAASKLIALGHRNISLIALEDDHASSLKGRMQGFIETYTDSQLAVRKDLWLTRINDRTREKGIAHNEAAAHETYVDVIAGHLLRHPEITAIFGTEYRASKAAWDAARHLKKRVPEDISIVSFDFDPGYLGLHVLTHVKQPQRGIGSCAVRVISDILGGVARDSRCFFLEGAWVEGDTIAPPFSASSIQ
jgi:DNA-binding LacI/PurR family transcriptional regulator